MRLARWCWYVAACCSAASGSMLPSASLASSSAASYAARSSWNSVCSDNSSEVMALNAVLLTLTTC